MIIKSGCTGIELIETIKEVGEKMKNAFVETDNENNGVEEKAKLEKLKTEVQEAWENWRRMISAYQQRDGIPLPMPEVLASVLTLIDDAILIVGIDMASNSDMTAKATATWDGKTLRITGIELVEVENDQADV